ncbi:hypothetical protein G3572_01590 [Rhodobacter sp. ETT8]|uniref:Uncharacterized protein n=1 Tax=Pseudotabrizicola algicola TaxID=2709381 RepID=A0A6B3RHL2_9RHOB|nr:hypothetical protein [Pseudotabrizicola algicola]
MLETRQAYGQMEQKMTPQQNSTPQQGGQQQQGGSKPAPQQQGGTPVFKDWASI